MNRELVSGLPEGAPNVQWAQRYGCVGLALPLASAYR